jgi:DNA-binding response OmpR family regulator
MTRKRKNVSEIINSKETDNSKKTLYISIIENDTIVQTMLVRIIHMMNINQFKLDIQTYQDGIEFFESNRLKNAGEHLLILDGVMPIMDGIEVLQKVKTTTSKYTYVLMLSGRKNKHEIEKAINLGADDYVTKPFSINDLQARIHQLLQRMH